MRVLVDTNVLIDVIAARQPYYADSAALWTLAEQDRITGFVSAISFTNIFYVVRRLQDAKAARKAILLIRDIFQVAVCDQQIINQAIAARINDFEDAVQYVSAIRVAANCLVSRNPAHFPKTGDCPVLTPGEFLAAHEQP